MPPTTRAKSRLLAKQQATEQQWPQPSQTSNLQPGQRQSQNEAILKDPVAAQQSKDKPQASTQKKSDTKSPAETILNISSITESHWPCKFCSCKKGVFHNLVDECIHCTDTIMEHERDPLEPWGPSIDFPCERREMVASLLQMVLQKGVVVIRATPQVGKTTLLKLLGYHIVTNEPGLEPVYIEWKTREERKHIPYREHLERARKEYVGFNASIRTSTRVAPSRPKARRIYLIDEAQSSYEEVELWNTLCKNRSTKNSPLYVLVCVYGAAGISRITNSNIESQALRMHSLHCLDLRRMLFNTEEVAVVIRKWAIHTRTQLDLGSGIVNYIYKMTGGHAGMVGMILGFTELMLDKYGVRNPLTPHLWHSILIRSENNFVDYLVRYGRGVWTSFAEDFVRQQLKYDWLSTEPIYRHLELWMIQEALKLVAQHPNGVTRTPKQELDALGFCHKMGYLHTEKRDTGTGEITFTFASPLHRRVAYRRLFPDLEPDEMSETSLKQLCINAIARLSPSALQPRRNQRGSGSWGIPEAAFQDELYLCLNIERQHLPIFSEYSHRSNGRIDFFVSDKKWGIELLQSGTSSDIARHIDRFSVDGKYNQWRILEDFIIINFCPRSALQKVAINKELQTHFLHVVVDTQALLAEIYSHDMQLLQSWSLGEGRQRSDTVDILRLPELEVPSKEMDENERLMREEMRNAVLTIKKADEVYHEERERWEHERERWEHKREKWEHERERSEHERREMQAEIDSLKATGQRERKRKNEQESMLEGKRKRLNST